MSWSEKSKASQAVLSEAKHYSRSLSDDSNTKRKQTYPFILKPDFPFLTTKLSLYKPISQY